MRDPGKRRVYLFTSPLAFLSSSHSCSGTPSLHGVDWEDTIALHDITSIPKISTGDFDIRTHVGVLILDEEASEDPSLTLVQKLTQGKIFEHPGTSLLRSADARGEIAKETYVKTITSLEFVGVTTRPWSELEDLLRNLIRVDQELDQKPPYRAILWNCHDIAIRLAYLAVEGNNTSYTLLREISVLFERAKSAFQEKEYSIPGAVCSGASLTGIATVAVPVVGTVAGLIFIGSWGFMMISNVQRGWARSSRRRWIQILEERFDRLRELSTA